MIHNISASANSSGVVVVVMLSLLFFKLLNLLTPFKTCAVTLSNLEKVLKFLQVNRFSICLCWVVLVYNNTASWIQTHEKG